MKLRIWMKRVVLQMMGLTIACLGVTLFLLADLGSNPFNVLIQGLFGFSSWPAFMTHGYVHMGVAFGIILVLLGGTVSLGTVICAFAVGPAAQVFMPVSGRICASVLDA